MVLKPDQTGSTDRSLAQALFEPRFVAVVGASDDISRIGGGLVLHFLKLHGFAGALYPVNPKRDRVQGLACFPALERVPAPVDLAVLAVPAQAAMEVLSALPAGHVRIALVVASGFGEQDEAGRERENALLDLAASKDIRLIGPNSVGCVNVRNGLVATISQFFDRKDIKAGDVALVTQSGAFGTAILAQSARDGVDFGCFLSSGNEADLEFSDFGRWLLERDDVRLVCGYIESIRDGDGFTDFARSAGAAQKPVVVLKVGTSETGAAAARSHTGALAGSDAVVQAVFDAHNIVRVQDGESLIDTLKVFTRTPTSQGLRLAVLSHSGGAGVMAADAAEAAGAELAPLPGDLSERLQQLLPRFATFGNPLDMTGGASLQGRLMADCLRAVLAHDAYDAALLAVNLIWRDGAILLEQLGAIANDLGKPFAVSWVAPEAGIETRLARAPFPAFPDPARAARALTRRLVFDERARRLAERPAPARPFPVAGKADLSSVAGQRRLLEACGVRLPREALARDGDEATAFLEAVGGPVVLKIASPDIAHRTEIGGVVTNVVDRAGLQGAYEAIIANVRRRRPQARIEGVLVQEMVEAGVEALLGVKRDPVFGPILAVGPGGTLVELLQDVALRPAPVSAREAEDLLDASSLGTLLAGYRGGVPLDRSALAEMVERVSWIGVDHPEIQELDLNPVMVLPEGRGCVAVDFAFALRRD